MWNLKKKKQIFALKNGERPVLFSLIDQSKDTNDSTHFGMRKK
jgi:hypothetical protein